MENDSKIINISSRRKKLDDERLNDEVSDFCYNYLKVKRKARSLDDVYCQLIVEGYLTFSEEELLNHLIKDGRFEFQNDGGVHSTLLKVQRKRKLKS